MDFCNFFYQNLIGHEPDDSKQVRKTKMTIQFLLDSGIPEEEIFGILMNSEIPEDGALLPEHLPTSVWSGLIERGKFYFHKSLQLTSPPPQFSVATGKTTVYPFYLEIRSRYSEKDLLEYCYRKSNIPDELRDEAKDGGFLRYLLNKYKRIEFVEPLDFVLALMDHSTEIRPVIQMTDITNYEAEVLETVKRWKQEAHAKQRDRIVWRSSNV